MVMSGEIWESWTSFYVKRESRQLLQISNPAMGFCEQVFRKLMEMRKSRLLRSLILEIAVHELPIYTRIGQVVYEYYSFLLIPNRIGYRSENQWSICIEPYKFIYSIQFCLNLLKQEENQLFSSNISLYAPFPHYRKIQSITNGILECSSRFTFHEI